MTVTTLTMRPMTEPPTKTGRYAVLHRGQVVKDAFYWTPEDVADKEKYPDPAGRLRAGWQQLPHWGPTHWIDLSDLGIPLDADHKRFWADAKGFPSDKPFVPTISVKTVKPVKKSLFKRIFSW